MVVVTKPLFTEDEQPVSDEPTPLTGVVIVKETTDVEQPRSTHNPVLWGTTYTIVKQEKVTLNDSLSTNPLRFTITEAGLYSVVWEYSLQWGDEAPIFIQAFVNINNDIGGAERYGFIEICPATAYNVIKGSSSAILFLQIGQFVEFTTYIEGTGTYQFDSTFQNRCRFSLLKLE